MPDPISPLGSPGQLQSQASAPVPAFQAAEPVSAPIAVQSSPERTTEAVSVEIAQKTITEKKPPPPTLDEAAKTIRNYLKNLPSDLQFQKDEQTGIVVFKVINPVTKEVIRQYPPDEVLAIARQIRKFAERKEQPGILLDQKS
jgi:flagellar protein FlaG